MTERLRLMAVHAHPDDESSKGAATMARYVSEGVEVSVVTLTGGERGSVLNPSLGDKPEIVDRLPEVRRAEMAEAARLLGVRHHWMGFEDSGFPEGDPPPPLPEGCFGAISLEDAARPLVELVRVERPHVILTYDEQGGYPHPDHVRCHEVSVEAFEAAGDPERYPGVAPPWEPLKLYYQMTFHKQRVLAMHEAMLAERLESPYGEWLERWVDRPDDSQRITTRIRCDAWFHVRDKALLAHATQVDPQGMWFRMPLELARRAWPTEDFELARSRVPTTTPEDDLFAGVRDVLEESA